ncbi:MAG: glycosyltransferase family 1 protein [Longimicrobiaceae bacterium]
MSFAQTVGARSPRPFDLVCLSHLRWDFVYQRPQHLLTRFARERRVFFVEEPVYGDGPRLEVRQRGDTLWTAVPHRPHGLAPADEEEAQRALLDGLLAEHRVRDAVLWYYTPMALAFTRHLRPLAVVYDCMDELSAFRGAPPALVEREADLLRRADLVFTGGRSLWEAKRARHTSVHCFPSGIDAAHFARARGAVEEPADQAAIPRPRIGFFGVLDERLDVELVRALAAARPEWSLVMIGPVVKIDPAELPRAENIHYLGPKSYDELPAYLAGWEVAALFFARNEATRFISPTKTPEYLAAGKPVVSTPIRDVARPYGEAGLVRIADGPAEWIAAVEAALAHSGDAAWLERVDRFLAGISWDRTWAEMDALLGAAVAGSAGRGTAAEETVEAAPLSVADGSLAGAG